MTNEIAKRITDFLTSIGLQVREQDLPDATFLPGIAVREGVLVVDEARLLYPGDLLHEAGHLALMASAERATANGEVVHEDPQAWEAGVVAWSYAAAMHLGIDFSVVLHDAGYQGKSKALLRTYGLGVYPGVGTLAALGLTRVGVNVEGPQYPKMVRWLRA